MTQRNILLIYFALLLISGALALFFTLMTEISDGPRTWLKDATSTSLRIVEFVVAAIVGFLSAQAVKK